MRLPLNQHHDLTAVNFIEMQYYRYVRQSSTPKENEKSARACNGLAYRGVLWQVRSVVDQNMCKREKRGTQESKIDTKERERGTEDERHNDKKRRQLSLLIASLIRLFVR